MNPYFILAFFFIKYKCVLCIDIDPYNTTSLKNAATLIADDIMNIFYNGDTNGIPGEFPPPVYWWQAGATWGDMIEYWYITGNSKYNDAIKKALLNQVGESEDYMPKKHYVSLGNDDQAFWGFAVMLAAERKFPDPPEDSVQWLTLAMAVFNRLSEAWDITTCKGGLRWQKFIGNKGYDYKNTISNGGLFMMSSRLARYTGNQTYVEWAEKVWDWIVNTEMVDENNMSFYDGLGVVGENCMPIKGEGMIQWTYNIGVFLGGSAAMYDYTKEPKWLLRIKKMIVRIKEVFLYNGILFESSCEPYNTCRINEPSFKGYLIRWMGYTVQLIPELANDMKPIFMTSAVGAGKSCTGGENNRICGTKWYINGYDNSGPKLGNEQSALEIMLNCILVSNLSLYAPPATKFDGTSKGDPSAGTGKRQRKNAARVIKYYNDEKIIASIFFTIFLLLSLILLTAFVYI